MGFLKEGAPTHFVDTGGAEGVFKTFLVLVSRDFRDFFNEIQVVGYVGARFGLVRGPRGLRRSLEGNLEGS